MGEPAIVMGDLVKGQCTIHLLANGAKAPPLPFNAPLTMQLAQTVLIDRKPAAVVGSWGMNTMSPHVGLGDPYTAVPAQIGRVTMGSGTVFFEGKPAANKSSMCTCCVEPGQLQNTVTDVQVGS
jgi:uncharacterized Zn-binding protein involved in type VI secretion